MQKVALLFTNNLRLRDNAVVSNALKDGGEVFPIYFFNTRISNDTELGIKKIDSYRANFIIQSLESLQKNLKHLGSDLFIIKGSFIDSIYDFCILHNIQKLVMQ